MPDEAPQKPLRVVSTCGTQARFVALFCRYFDGDRMWILTRDAKALGEALSVEMTLSDGSTVLAFSGRVIESSTTNGTPYGRPGMLVQITSVPPASRGVMHLLHMASAEWGRQTRVAVGDLSPTDLPDPDGATATVTMEIDPTEAPDPNAPGYLPMPPPLPPVPQAGDPDDAPTQAVTDVPTPFPEPLTARGKRFREAVTKETLVEGRRREARTAEEAALEAETSEMVRSRPLIHDTTPSPLTDSIASMLEPGPPGPPGYWARPPDLVRSTGAVPPLRYPFLQRSVRMPIVLAIAGGVFVIALLLGLAIG
ncbi:MAG TPA: hypothetical protein VMZ28_29100 [Kofleriaceae bacterium]|nr:hypothetical protein [Kofleriaceae bacterium]